MGIAITPKIQYTRDDNGRAVMKAQDANNILFSGVGYISGNGTLSFGSTDSTYDLTQITYEAEKDEENLLVLVNTNGQNVNILGENANVSCRGGNAQRTIQIDANNSNIDLGNAAGSQIVTITANHQDNKVKLGTGNDLYTDCGNFNYANDNGGANTFITKETNHGAVIEAGAGNDQFIIGGKFGVIDGGNGNNTYNTTLGKDATASSVTIDGSFKNVIIGGNGNETYIDKGLENIFIGNGGNDYVEFSGIKGLADLRNNYGESSAKFLSSAIENFVFTQTSTILKTDAQGNTTEASIAYDIYQKMLQYGWTLEDFFEASEISVANPDRIDNHNALSSTILAKLKAILGNEYLTGTKN